MRKSRGFMNLMVRGMITVIGSIAGARIAGWAFDQVSNRS